MISLVVLASALIGCVPQAHPQVIVLGHRLWQVSSQGEITPFPYEFPASYLDSIEGSTLPLPSPDGQWIAFGWLPGDFDVHLLKVDSWQERRITRFGVPPRRGYTYAGTLVVGWSPDSRELLLNVAPGETTSEEGELSVPDTPYGFCIYDLGIGGTRCVALPKGFQFVAWLPDGRFLGVLPGRAPQEEETVVLLRSGDATRVTVTSREGTIQHVRVSADAKWLTGLLVGSGEQRTARIVKVNLATLSMTPLASLGPWTGNERPALSPDNQHFSYAHQARMLNGIPQEDLIVDGRLIYSCSGPIDYDWVDPQRIALACQDDVIVLDTATRHPLSRSTISASQTRR